MKGFNYCLPFKNCLECVELIFPIFVTGKKIIDVCDNETIPSDWKADIKNKTAYVQTDNLKEGGTIDNTKSANENLCKQKDEVGRCLEAKNDIGSIDINGKLEGLSTSGRETVSF